MKQKNRKKELVKQILYDSEDELSDGYEYYVGGGRENVNKTIDHIATEIVKVFDEPDNSKPLAM